MVKKERELQEAHSKKEKAERLLSNLENLKKDGTIDEVQYESMKGEYTQMLNGANTEIEQTKNELSRELESTQKDLDIYNQELNNLEVRFKVGELSADMYRKSEQRTRSKIERTQAAVSELKRLLDSKISADVGGAVEVKTEGKKAKAVTAAGAGVNIPAVENITSSIKETAASDFTEFVTTFEEVTTPRIKLIGLIGGVLMIISLFLPWASISLFIQFNFSAFDLHGGLAAMGLIGGIICVLATFLERSNARGILHVAMGTLALLVLLVVWFSAPSISGAEGLIGEIMEEVMKMITIREGFYLYIVSSIMVIIGGLFELGEG